MPSATTPTTENVPATAAVLWKNPVLVDAALELVGAPLVADVVRNEVSVTTPPDRSVVTLVFVGGAVVVWVATDVGAADVVLVTDVDFELVSETLVLVVTEVAEVVVVEDVVLVDVDVGVMLDWVGGEEEGGGVAGVEVTGGGDAISSSLSSS